MSVATFGPGEPSQNSILQIEPEGEMLCQSSQLSKITRSDETGSCALLIRDSIAGQGSRLE